MLDRFHLRVSFHPWTESFTFSTGLFADLDHLSVLTTNCWKLYFKTGSLRFYFKFFYACMHFKKKYKLSLLQCFYCDIDIQKKSIKDSYTVGCTKERNAAIFSNWIFVSFVKVTQQLKEPPHSVQGTCYPLGLLLCMGKGSPPSTKDQCHHWAPRSNPLWIPGASPAGYPTWWWRGALPPHAPSPKQDHVQTPTRSKVVNISLKIYKDNSTVF